MERILNTALLYIANFLSVNAVMFERTAQDFTLPNPYSSDLENQLMRQQLGAAPKDSLLLVQDGELLHYCFIFPGKYILLIGPYRTKIMRTASVPAHLSATPKMQAEYLQYYNRLPLLSEETVKLAAHTLFVSLYGSSETLTESSIDIRQYTKGDVVIPEAPLLTPRQESSEYENDLMIYFMDQIRTGNFNKAISAYRKMMLNKGTSFILLNTVEGLSTIRSQLRIALIQAGLPASSFDPLLLQFKKAGRVVTSIEEARQLCEHLISQSCSLVRKTRTVHYSLCIATAIDFIHQNISQPLTIEAVSKAAALSPNSFSAKFRAEVGMPPSAYILKERLQIASNLLTYTNMSIPNICTQIGILDSNYFSRCFKREYGISPSMYRKDGILHHKKEQS